MPCHAQCIDSIANNCKVPPKKQADLLPPPKKPKTVSKSIPVQPPPSLMPPTSVLRVQPTSPPMLITVVNTQPQGGIMPAMFAQTSQAPALVHIRDLVPNLVTESSSSSSTATSSSKTAALTKEKATEKASTVVTTTQKAPVIETKKKTVSTSSTQKGSTVSSTTSSAGTQTVPTKSKQKTNAQKSSSASTSVSTTSLTTKKADNEASTSKTTVSAQKTVEKAKDTISTSPIPKTAAASSSTRKPASRALKRPAPPVPDTENGGPKKKSKKGEVVLLKATKTNEDYESSTGNKMVVEEAKAPPKNKNAKKGDVKLTKVTPLSTGYEKDPIVSFKEAKSKAVGFSPPDPRTSLASVQKSKSRGVDVSSPAKSPKKIPEHEKLPEENGRSKPVKNIYTGFESSKVIKMEQTSQLR